MADTDALIQQALKEEEAERKRAKQEKAAHAKETKAARKGKTLEQIEDEEGGPVKESQVGMAQTRRAAKRKGTGVDDTELVDDVEAVEEDLEQEEEDGIKLEAFNLKEEREKGYFDDAGNYVEREDKDEAELAQDAWLQSDEAKVVSDEVRRKIEERQRREAAAEAAGPLSAAQIARLQFAASQLLQPGETVAAGLKRLGGHSRRPAKRSKTRGGEAADMAADVAPDPAAKEQFNKLTEVAMQLMDAGEADVYTQNKEYFERAAAVYIDLPGPSKVLEGGAGKAAYEDADEDMFAEDDDKPKQAAAAAPAAAAPAAAPAAAAAAAPQRELPRGDIVLVGGHDSGSWLDSVDYFSPHDCVWASLPLLGKPRSFSAAVGTANEVFIAGGGDGLEWYDSVVRYDRKAGLMGGWQELAPLQVARGSLAAAVAGGYLFVYGGGKPNEQYNVVEWYDPTSNRWLPGPPLQRKRFALGGAAMDGAIYAVGGYDGSTYLDCAERLDPRTDRWEMLRGSMASKRGGHAVAAAGGQLYALGGFNSVQAIPHCEAYEPRMNAWRQIADMSDARAYGSSASLGSTVFAVGGLQSDMQTHAILIECYNPVVDVWEHVELPPNANPRRSFLAACGIE